MPIEDLHRRLADDSSPDSVSARGAQALLGAAAPLYGAGAWANRILYDFGLRKTRRLPALVFSVGNITLGGTGKTPFCLWLARWLEEQRRKPAILTRGYGREDESHLLTVHDGRRLRSTVRMAGDEPVLLAKRLGRVPVLACADRYRAGRLALRRYHVDTFILDDGFQHHSLARQGEIVLLDATRPLTDLRLFPRGTLREPLQALNRADLIVLTRSDQSPRANRMARMIQSRLGHVPIARTRLEIRHLRRLADGEQLPVSSVEGKRVLVAAGVGNPGAVRRTVEDLGAKIVGFRTLRDHAAITGRMIRSWEQARKSREADFVLITEKDAVKAEETTRLPTNLLALVADLRFMGKRDRVVADRALKACLRAGSVLGYLT